MGAARAQGKGLIAVSIRLAWSAYLWIERIGEFMAAKLILIQHLLIELRLSDTRFKD